MEVVISFGSGIPGRYPSLSQSMLYRIERIESFLNVSSFKKNLKIDGSSLTSFLALEKLRSPHFAGGGKVGQPSNTFAARIFPNVKQPLEFKEHAKLSRRAMAKPDSECSTSKRTWRTSRVLNWRGKCFHGTKKKKKKKTPKSKDSFSKGLVSFNTPVDCSSWACSLCASCSRISFRVAMILWLVLRRGLLSTR